MTKAILLALATFATACGVATSDATADDATGGDESNVTSEATLQLTKDFKTNLSGTPKAGGSLLVDYALERLPQCRGNVGGGGPGWNIGGFYSENGGPAKTFAVTELTADGKDRVAKPARIALSQGGDLAIWFQVSSAFGCHEFDSQFGQNFHVQVEGGLPEATASLVFAKDGTVQQEGALRVGQKVKVRYEQARLPQCRQSQGGHPRWSISGFASVNGEDAHAFSTGRPEGADRVEVEALIDLPRSGQLALWFEVNDTSGCHEVDSQGGKNYTFPIE